MKPIFNLLPTTEITFYCLIMLLLLLCEDMLDGDYLIKIGNSFLGVSFKGNGGFLSHNAFIPSARTSSR